MATTTSVHTMEATDQSIQSIQSTTDLHLSFFRSGSNLCNHNVCFLVLSLPIFHSLLFPLNAQSNEPPDPGSPSWHNRLSSAKMKAHPAFDTSLGLNDFEESAFLAASRSLLENKMAEFIAEFKAFMQTQSQIYELKQEHISIAHDDHESHRRELVDSIQKKIDSKKEELWYFRLWTNCETVTEPVLFC